MIPFNLFNETIYFPWQIGVPIIAAMVAAAGLIAFFILRRMAKKTYVCPNCGYRFKAEPRRLLTLHFGNTYRLKCPSCGKVDYCAPSYDQDDK